MDNQLQGLQTLRAKVTKLKETLDYYEDLFKQDGIIDAQEQSHLDKMNATISLITDTITQKEGEIQGAVTPANTSETNSDSGMPDAAATTNDTTNSDLDTANNTAEETPVETPATPSASIGASVGVRGVNNPADVTIVQTLLNKKGNSLKVDGKIGNNTNNAIKAFQATLGHSNPDGRIDVGGKTWQALAASASTSTPATDSSTDATSETNNDTSTGNSTDEASTETPTETPATPSASIGASVGVRGVNNPADVTIVQTLLNEKGNSLKVDGKIGNNTNNAIKAFQATLGHSNPDGRIDVGGKTWQALTGNTSSAPATDGASGPDTSSPADPNAGSGDFTHANWNNVSITYGSKAVRLNARADKLIRSILAASGQTSARLTSTLRSYHDQARITKTQTYPNRGGATVAQWYGQDVLDACKTMSVADFAVWWEARDKRRGRVSSRHLSGWAMDVVPNGNRSTFASKVQELVGVTGSGVRKIIKKGQMNEPVDHVEFMFVVC